MDIGRTLGRAWEITWRWKVLWILGFLAALGQGSSGANSGYQFSNQDLQNGNLPNFNLPAGAEGLLIAFACLAVIVGIVLFVISVMARGSLIAGVAQIEAEGNTTLGQAWVVGQRRFWTLFGIGVLMALPVLLVGIAVAIGVAVLAGGVGLAGAQGNDAIGPVMAGLFACICPSVCLIIVLAVVLEQIRIYAERAAILEGLGWIDAFRRGWQVLRANLGSTILLWVVFLVLGLVIGAIALAVSLPLVIPLVALFQNGTLDQAALIPICGLGLLATIVGAVINAVLTTFTSGAWTLAYRQMTGAGLSTATTPTTPNL